MAFDHLSLPFRITGKYNSPYGKGKLSVIINPSDQTLLNQDNREAHGKNLKAKSIEISEKWVSDFEKRKVEEMPEIPQSIPLFLQVDPKVFKPDSLKSFGIDIIAEEKDGFLIGASADINLSSLQDKIDKFLAENGKYKNTAAKLWDIITGNQWRIEHILSKELLDKWEQIDDAEVLIIDIAIACHIAIPEYPARDEANITEEVYNGKVLRWEERKRNIEIKRDELSFERQDELESFIIGHKGEVVSSYVNSSDSFSCRVELSGKGLKDLVFNYPYLFEVEEYDDLSQNIIDEKEIILQSDFEIQGPEIEDPNVCIIDSGIQEKHLLLKDAIDSNHSFSYVKGEETITSDNVRNGGHGTRVAGAVLYEAMPLNGTIKLNAWVQNARVLDSNNSLQSNLYPPYLIKDIANNYFNSFKTRIFNMSISSSRGHITTRMSKWAESIDREIFENDILFILPTGNIFKDEIASQIRSGTQYPDYLFKRKNRIANPSQSLLSITVGSICSDTFEDLDRKSFGEKDFPSSFSRTGLGIWESIKPELVEYGGDYVYEKNQPTPLISQKEDTNIDLIRSTLNGGPSTSKDAIGTSFTAPRISSIIAKLQKLFPEESTLLYKALIIQSARWPNNVFLNSNPRLNFIRLFGYGIPNLKRATTNDDFRVSLVSSGVIVPKQADVYEVKIPEEIRRVGDSYDILIEVTITFKAKPRRTRRLFRSYFSGWVDWQSSKFGESIDAFRERLVTNIGEDEYEETDDETINQEKIPWVIGSRSNAGINGVKLNNNTSQKDWAIVQSNILTESFSIGIIGHAGWDKDLKSELPYSVVVSFEAINKDIEIYNRIRIENPVEVRINT